MTGTRCARARGTWPWPTRRCSWRARAMPGRCGAEPVLYTEARLSPVGQVALAAERGQIVPVPIGLINGNTHRQATRPPFRPAAVIDAIRQVLLRPRLTARQITALVGPPDFITGCTVTGDLAALAAGQRTELGLQARVTVTDAAHASARVTKAAIPGRTPPSAFLRTPAGRSSSSTTSRRTSAPTTPWSASTSAPGNTHGKPATRNWPRKADCRSKTCATSPPAAITGSHASRPTARQRRCCATSS